MVSVIIPTFNRAPFLKKAIQSVLSQTLQDFELIVVDDGSEDNTASMVLNLAPEIRYIRQQNRGPSAARNSGIRQAKGDLLAFLDSDDWWDNDKLAVQLLAMEEAPDFLVSHTQEVWYKNGRLLNQKDRHRKSDGYIFERCLELCVVSMSTAMVRKGLFDAVGLFDETLPCCEDYDFWLRVSAKYPFLLVDRPLTFKDGGRPDQSSFIYGTGIDGFRIKAIQKILESDLSEGQRNVALRELRRKCRIYGNGCLKHGKFSEGAHYLEISGARL